LAGVDGPWLRQKLGIIVSIKTGPAVHNTQKHEKRYSKNEKAILIFLKKPFN